MHANDTAGITRTSLGEKNVASQPFMPRSYLLLSRGEYNVIVQDSSAEAVVQRLQRGVARGQRLGEGALVGRALEGDLVK